MRSNSHHQVFIDGPNVDMVLGMDVLGRRPMSHERPRWKRVLRYCRTEFGCNEPMFVLNGDRFAPEGRVSAFRRAIRSLGYNVVCPTGLPGDPVDAFIQQQLTILDRFNRPCSVAVLTHDHGYAPYLDSILMSGGKVAVVGFPEEMSPALLSLARNGATIIDLERELGAFDIELERPHWMR